MKFGLRIKMSRGYQGYIDEDGDKIRKDENHEKNYLLGKYGAIPNMRTIKFLEED